MEQLRVDWLVLEEYYVLCDTLDASPSLQHAVVACMCQFLLSISRLAKSNTLVTFVALGMSWSVLYNTSWWHQVYFNSYNEIHIVLSCLLHYYCVCIQLRARLLYFFLFVYRCHQHSLVQWTKNVLWWTFMTNMISGTCRLLVQCSVFT